MHSILLYGLFLGLEKEEVIKVKNLKKTVKRAICALLTTAMLCTDTGMIVFAAEVAEQDIWAENTEEGSAEEIQADEIAASEDELQEGEDVTEAVPVEAEITEENPIEGDTEALPEEENVVESEEEGL